MLQPVASVPVQSEQRQAVFSDEPRPVDPKDKKNSFYKRTASTYLLYGEAKACAKAYAEIEQEMSNSKPRESERPAWLLACSFSDSSCTTSGQREAFAIDLGHRITSTFLLNYFDDENWLEFGQDKIRLQGKDHEQKYGHLFKQKLSPQNEATPRAAVLGGMGPIACATAFHSLVETIDKDETPDDLKRDLVLHLWSDPDMQVAADGIQMSDLVPKAVLNFKDARSSYESFINCPLFTCGCIALCNTFHLMLYANDDKVVPQINTWNIGQEFKEMALKNLFCMQKPRSPHFLSLVLKVRDYVAQNHKGKRVACMSTINTASFGMYEHLLKEAPDVEPYTDEKIVKGSQKGIDLVKHGDIAGAKETFLDVVTHARENQVEVILLGCTEIPVALSQAAVNEHYENSLDLKDKISPPTVISTAEVGVDALVKHIKSTANCQKCEAAGNRYCACKCMAGQAWSASPAPLPPPPMPPPTCGC